MKCVFCEKEVESIHEAIELGWHPDFWVGEVSYQGPVCGECLNEHLFVGDDGEYVLKPDRAVPPLALRSDLVGPKKELSVSILTARPKFPLGRLVATPGALEALAESGQSPDFFLEKHQSGDWGEVGDDDKRANDQALIDGSRILSAYRTLKRVKIWIITEATDDEGRRASTTALLPSEY